MARKRILERPAGPHAKRADSVAIVDAIVGAARELAAHGIQGVSMRAVAQRAGVGEASVYRYFADKGALFAEVFRRQHESIVDDIERIIVDAPTLEAGIDQAIDAFLGVGMHELQLRRALNFDVPLSWSSDELTAFTGRLRDILVRWARTHTPELHNDELERRVFYTVATLRGVLQLRMLQPERAPSVADQRAVLSAMVRRIASGGLPTRLVDKE